MSRLLEREGDLAAVDAASGEACRDGRGGALLIEGPAGVGKSALLGALEDRAAADGYRVLSARGSEMERDFGFGVVRQLAGPLLRALDADARAEHFAGPAGLAAPIFGFDGEVLEAGAAESSLYGLFWFFAGLSEGRPLVLAIDDAHWADPASLRFARYLARRLAGLPVLLALTARPDEPGVATELVRGLVAELDVPILRPAPLSETGTAELVRERLGEPAAQPFAEACHEATGGNPFLIEELLVELSAEGVDAAVAPDRIAAMGPRRIGAAVDERAARVDPLAPDVTRAAAVLGDATDLAALTSLTGVERGQVGTIVDRLAAASILAAGPVYRFVHPLVRQAVYEDIPSAHRGDLHARAAAALSARGAEPEAVAAHLLLCEPGSVAGGLEALGRAADAAVGRGAPESAIAYLRRALLEPGAERAELLGTLGSLEVVVRDPESIPHLQEAAETTIEPQKAIWIYLELADLLSLAGQWDATVATVDAGLARFADADVDGVLDLEAFRAAYRGYDPALSAEYERDLPRLRALVEASAPESSRRLRWMLAGLGSVRDTPRPEIEALCDPGGRDWGMRQDGREITTVSQAALALLVVEAFDEVEAIGRAVREDGRQRGALLATVAGVGLAAAADSRRGRLRAAEADLAAMVEVIEANELSLMALTTMAFFCVDTVVERGGLEGVRTGLLALELPPTFAATQSGGMLLETRAAIKAAEGDRDGAIADLRGVAEIFLPFGATPRFSRWRSNLALLLPEDERDEALALAVEELDLARAVESPVAEGAVLRALGLLRGGEEGVTALRESVAVLRDAPNRLELARSQAELGAALRRGKLRSQAREHLREAGELAQECGAERLEERIDEELRIAGARRRRRAFSGAESLTPSERRVAVAAARGATNREIAQELFVSLRTVEMHLTNTYRKLDISSRAQLATAIAS
ncbi:MAG: AAA family ATPase [Actinobacteria bacterium]|nr:AAA family ATPase [Actinomycetota bacterium]